MSKRPSVTAAVVRRKMQEAEAEIGSQAPAELLTPAAVQATGEGDKATARTRVGKKFITFPVSPPAKTQFDILAASSGIRREELMREALRDLFTKYGQPPIV